MPIEERLIGGTIMLALAILFGFLGVFAFLRGYKRKTKGSAASGVVVGYRERRRIDRTTYSPEVEFQTPSGEKVVFTASFGSSRRPTLGRKVKVLYYPSAPEDADIASLGNFWILPFILLVFATIFLAASVMFYTGFVDNPQ